MKSIRAFSLIIIILLLCSIVYGYQETIPTNYPEDNEYFWFDSLNVRFFGNWPFGESYAIAYDSTRNLMFMGSGGGVYIIDASDKYNLAKLSERIHTRGFVNELFYEDSTQLLYIAAQKDLEIWDVSNPQYPVRLSLRETYYDSRDVFVSGSYAYVPTSGTGLIIFDISDPQNPSVITLYETPSRVVRVYVVDTLAFINCVYHYIRILDVSDPYNPEEIGYFFNPRRCYGIVVSDTFAFSTNGDGLMIINVADPTDPELWASCSSSCLSYSLDVSGSYAFVPNSPGWPGLHIFDVSDPSDPFEIVNYNTISGADVDVSGSYAYIAGIWDGAWVLDVSDPSIPTQISQYESPAGASQVFISDSLGYIASGSTGLWVLDMAEPANPYNLGIIDSLGGIRDFTIVDTLAYVTTRWDYQDERFLVVNIADYNNPQIIGWCKASNWHAGDVFVLDSFAYVCNMSESRLKIIDISDPENPYTIGGTYAMGEPIGVYVRDGYAYIASGNFCIMDVQDPSWPQVVGTCETLGWAHDVCVLGSYAYVADYNALTVIDISDPQNPYMVGNYKTDDHAKSCTVQGSLIYLGSNKGVYVFDISVPQDPPLVGFYETPGACVNVFVVEPYIYCADSWCGLQIYEFLGTGVEEEPDREIIISFSIKLLQNPVKGNYIELSLISANTRNADLTLYNLLGQKVKTHSFNNLKAGRNILRLDTKELKSGTYFLKLERGPNIEPIKVILLK